MPQLNRKMFETCERLVAIESDWIQRNAKLIKGIFKKIETKKSDTLTRTEKVCLSEYFDIRFSSGKIMAYVVCLQDLNGGRITIPEEFPLLTQWVKYNLSGNVV